MPTTMDMVISGIGGALAGLALLIWHMRVTSARMVSTKPTTPEPDEPRTVEDGGGTRYVLHIPAPAHLPALAFVMVDAPESEARNA